MFQPNQIRNIEKFTVINNFDIICQICKQIRGCHYYYISKEDNMIYASHELLYALHSVDLPSNLQIYKSFAFVRALVDENIANQYSSFIRYDDYPWLLFPTERRAEHMDYNIVFDYTTETTTVTKDGSPVDFITIDNPRTTMFTLNKLIEVVYLKNAAKMWLGEAQFFGDQEMNTVIKDIMNNKASAMGSKYLRLTSMTGKNYGMLVFKNLFNLNKADGLVICIRDRKDNPNIFQAEFITSKRKSPLPSILPFYKETTYATFINI